MSKYGEPWQVDEADRIADRDGSLVSGCPSQDELERIVACVNFCTGLSNEELEKPATKRSVQGLGSIIHSIELRDIFAGLIVAGLLSKISENPNFYFPDNKTLKDVYTLADALLEAREATRR